MVRVDERIREKSTGATQHEQRATDAPPLIGEVVIIQDESRNRDSWKLGIVERLIMGRDGIVRGAKLRAGKGVLERAVRHLYPLKLSYDRTVPKLNPEAAPCRPRRNAAVTASLSFVDAAQEAES